MNRAACDNALLAYGCRPVNTRTRRGIEAAAWILAYGAAIAAIWYDAVAARANGWL
ncbi:hypothetical protein PWR63_17635 [Paraburkholderia sp. A2WS-5]|uniref:hypothetical protein n=1 Tax=unclassified Paraburkholderia TaxID=2615204 RepID=UPI003B826867